jgi:hypothetical protein
VVTVRLGPEAWTIMAGELLTIGRSRACDVRLPDDDHLSRRAASLRPMDDFVLVRNLSTTKPLVLRPARGEDTVVEPGAAVTSLPHREFHLVLAGRGTSVVVIDVDTRLLTSPQLVDDSATGSPDTVTAPMNLTPAQHRVLVALCEPLLTGQGADAAPATYAKIGERLERSPHYVRNVVKAIREGMAGHGVPGLTMDDGSPAQADDFRWALARSALRNRWVTAADVAGPGPDDGVPLDLVRRDGDRAR